MPQHKRGPWSQSEDQYLLHLVSVHGAHNWVRISSTIQTRSPKQCRERFHQNLKPNLNHDPITPEEGVLIEQMVGEMGKRWAEIARRLRGRSDNAVKNWWNGGMNRRRRSNNHSRRADLDVQQPSTNNSNHVQHQQQQLQQQSGESIPHQLPSHHHTLPPQFAQHALHQHVPHHVVPQQFYGHPMYHPSQMSHGLAPQISLPSNVQFYQRHPSMVETPLPSPSAFSQMSAEGAPSLISDCSSISTRSPHDGTSPIELPPLSGSRNDRRHSSAPMLRLGVPGAFVSDGEFQGPAMSMKSRHEQHVLQEVSYNMPHPQQQHFHPQPAYLPSQPRQPSPLQHAPMMPPQQYHVASQPPQAQPQHQQRTNLYPPHQMLPSTPMQLPSISKLARAADAKPSTASGTGIFIDPALEVHTPVGAPPSTPDGSPKDKMSLSNLTH